MKRFWVCAVIIALLMGLVLWNSLTDHDHGKEGEEHHDHEESEASVGGVGKENAVIAADEHNGIQLSRTALEAIGVKTIPYAESHIPRDALVFYQDNVGVYRLRDGWLKLIPVQLQQQNDVARIVSTELQLGDHIVIKGMGLLRAAELDAFSGEVGHSH